MKCLFCGVKTGDRGNHATVDACADALRVEVKRLIDRGGAWPFAEPCHGDPGDMSASQFEDRWLSACTVAVVPALSGASRG